VANTLAYHDTATIKTEFFFIMKGPCVLGTARKSYPSLLFTGKAGAYQSGAAHVTPLCW
jgi:hypothetical protein